MRGREKEGEGGGVETREGRRREKGKEEKIWGRREGKKEGWGRRVERRREAEGGKE